MSRTACKLTVYFEEPFWIGVFEQICDGKLSVGKVIFGAEPKDYEILEGVLRFYGSLEFSPTVPVALKESKKNPKRTLRETKRQLQTSGIGTKSQQALKLQQEQNKQKRKARKREQKQLEAERMFELKQQKKKEKHKGH